MTDLTVKQLDNYTKNRLMLKSLITYFLRRSTTESVCKMLEQALEENRGGVWSVSQLMSDVDVSMQEMAAGN